MKKKTFWIIVFLILFLDIFMYIIPSSYKKKYKVNKYKIVEKYTKKNNLYEFVISDNDNSFIVQFKKDYLTKKKLIKKIKKIKITDGYCLEIKGSKLDFYPVCIQNDEAISYHLVDELKSKINKKYYSKIKVKDKTYDTLEINYLNNKSYLLWNYRYFYYLNNNETKKIDLFLTDYYQIELAAKVNEYLFIPNYDEGFSFSSAYVINMKNGKKTTMELKNDISIESRTLGIYKKSIYLLDEKNSILYEIVPHKKKIRKVSGRILENNKFKNYSIKTIINNKMTFKYDKDFNYKIMDNKLYLIQDDNKVLLTKNNITSIVLEDNETVYYLIGDNLYMYNPYYGNVLLINNFEWSFNSNNMIFIY